VLYSLQYHHFLKLKIYKIQIFLNYYSIIAYIALFSVILPIYFSFLRFKVLDREMKILLLLLLVGFVTDLLSVLFLRSQFVPWLVQLYIPLEAGLVLLIISSWQTSQKLSKFLKLIIGFYIVFWFCAKITFESFNSTYYLTGTVSSVILTLTAGYTLFIVISERLQSLHRDKRFWVLLSFVLYYTGILLPVTLQSILVSYSKESFLIAWSITWILATFSHIFYTIAFLCPQNPA
jgi:hypothetical protein